jgi:hypothetical protein
LRNISQNKYGATEARFDCEAETVTVLNCSFGPVEDDDQASRDREAHRIIGSCEHEPSTRQYASLARRIRPF